MLNVLIKRLNVKLQTLLPGTQVCDYISLRCSYMSSTSRKLDPLLTDADFLANIDVTKLSPDERIISDRHIAAMRAGEDFYTDPVSGLMVLSRLAHIRRGDCCGNACRHCPYGHVNVNKQEKPKYYNTAFYM